MNNGNTSHRKRRIYTYNKNLNEPCLSIKHLKNIFINVVFILSMPKKCFLESLLVCLFVNALVNANLINNLTDLSPNYA